MSRQFPITDMDKFGIKVGILTIVLIVSLALWFRPQEDLARAKHVACRADGGVPVIAADSRFECVRWSKP
jgi:hypothetical protein